MIRDDAGNRLFEGAFFFGTHTNNAAEYLALLKALEIVPRYATTDIIVHSDSELLVRQMTGEYRVKNPQLQQLHEQVQFLLIKITRWTFRHVRREQNARADELANMAMDKRGDVVVFDAQATVSSGDSSPRKANPPASDSPDPSDKPTSATERAEPRGALPPATVDGALPVAVSAQAIGAQPGGDQTACPAGGPCFKRIVVGATLPANICVHAAQSFLPTLLAIQNTDPTEFFAVPTLTVHCSRRACRSSFQLSPHRDANGSAHG